MLGDLFEWDDEKAAENLVKHGVAFDEAASALLDAHAVDEAHPFDPMRLRTIAFSKEARLLMVVWTVSMDERMRIISARRAAPSEHTVYARRIE